MTESPSQPCVLDQTSDVRQVLNLIADKWTALVILSLSRKTKRYGALHREIGGVSQKMLTQTLRNLEKSGLIHRQVYPVVPPMVEYSLTPLGKTLVEPLKTLCNWASEHFHEVEFAQAGAADSKTLDRVIT
ncbi:transcriptional regulator [Pleurocapsa sp. CCALA 161]|uniref:winged helix-turn-helix transcriptional regulator n=1 Tax=Pleurocapsa sp. CCALA 161 TaxID=2107688 RepID=UPI000D07A9FA|nr:helix-turn-helix domain-containing protein [Pleurocapsa sp. CCALA 161]PSB08865.1 transcriptional regulator [Pleurocapsa sp. CCALA 161]